MKTFHLTIAAALAFLIPSATTSHAATVCMTDGELSSFLFWVYAEMGEAKSRLCDRMHGGYDSVHQAIIDEGRGPYGDHRRRATLAFERAFPNIGNQLFGQQVSKSVRHEFATETFDEASCRTWLTEITKNKDRLGSYVAVFEDEAKAAMRKQRDRVPKCDQPQPEHSRR